MLQAYSAFLAKLRPSAPCMITTTINSPKPGVHLGLKRQWDVVNFLCT